MVQKTDSSRSKKVAVINPEIFRIREEKLRFCFFATSDYITVREMLEKIEDIDVFPLRGRYDIIIIHADRELDTLTTRLADVMALLEDRSIFTVDRILKYHGFSSRSISVDYITSENAAKLLELYHDYNASNVTKEERKWFLENGLILGYAVDYAPASKKHRRSIALINVSHESQEIRRVFEIHVLKQLAKYDVVTSIYQGHSAFGFDYLLDITADPYKTDEVIDELHRRSHELMLRVYTRTTDLQLPIVRGFWGGILRPSLSYQDLWLMKEAKSLNINIPPLPKRIMQATSLFIRLRGELQQASDEKSKDVLSDIALKYCASLLSDDAKVYGNIFVQFVEWMKTKLIKTITDEVGSNKDSLKELQNRLGLKNWKISQFTFGDVCDAYVKWLRSKSNVKLAKNLEPILINANMYRNKLVHDGAGEIDESFILNIDDVFEKLMAVAARL